MEEEVANDVEGVDLEIMEEEVFYVDRKPLFCTPAPGHYQHSPRSMRLNHTRDVEQAVHSWRKGPPFLDALDNVEYYSRGELDTTHPAWTNLTSNIPRLPQVERV